MMESVILQAPPTTIGVGTPPAPMPSIEFMVVMLAFYILMMWLLGGKNEQERNDNKTNADP